MARYTQLQKNDIEEIAGSYDLAIGPGAVCAAAAALCFLAIKKPPQLTKEPAFALSLA